MITKNGKPALGATCSEWQFRADSVEKLFAASANFQKAENCSPLVKIHQKNSVKFEITGMLFCQL
jgi:hypothetical protein